VTSGDSIIPLSNIQAQWESMTEEERSLVHEQLEELQARDWRSMSLDEKRAGLYASHFHFTSTLSR
jgi:cytochrome c oxidase subunit 4